MKRRVMGIFLVLCMILTTLTPFGTAALAQTGTNKSVDFSDLISPMGSFAGTTVLNTPPSSDENYGKLYYWEGRKGVYGKGSGDTSFYFKSEYDGASLPDVSGVAYISNPLFNVSGGVDGITADEYYHISFEFLRESGKSGGYVMLRPNCATGKTLRMANALTIGKAGENTDSVSILGVGAGTIEYKKWNRVDLIFTPQVDFSQDKDGSDMRTVAEAYLNGVKVSEPFAVDCDSASAGYQCITGMDHIRFTFDPKSEGGLFPKTETYVDNIVSEVLTEKPVIHDFVLTHSDGTLNGYIDNKTKTIDYYGQTAEEMLDGLSSDIGAKFRFADVNGNSVSDLSAPMLGMYLIAEKDGQTVYYSVKNCMNAVTSSEYTINYDKNTVPAYSYTPVEYYKGQFKPAGGYVLKVTDENGDEVAGGDMKSGYFLEAYNTATGETDEKYEVNFYSKEVYVDFDDFNETKFYWGGLNNTQKGWSWNSSALDTDKLANDGVSADEAAYYLPVSVSGRGKVLKIYSKGLYGKDYSHITFTRSAKPAADYYGTKFVMEYSFMLPTENDSIRFQCKYKMKDGTESSLNTPINAANGQITVWNTAVGTYKPGQWYDLKIYNDTVSGQVIVYINGAEKYNSVIETVKKFSYFSDVRAIQHFCADNTTVYESYLDKFAVYGVGGLTESFISMMDVSLKSDVFVVDGETVNKFKGMTAGQLKAAAITAEGAVVEVFNEDGSAADDGAEAVRGMYIKVSSKDLSNSAVYVLDVDAYRYGEIDYSVNGIKVDGRFAKGTVKAWAEVDSYVETDAAVILAQYRGGRLVNSAVAEKTVFGKGQRVEASIEIDDAKDSTLKIMLWESTENAMPVMDFVELTPFETGKISSFSKTYPNYSQKAITFSYDDGNAGDAQIVEIFNKYQLKGTFNLITNWIIQDESNYNESNAAAVVKRYEGHEIATHSDTHPRMYVNSSSEVEGGYTPLTLEQCFEEFATANRKFELMCGGTTPRGGAWPYNAPYSRAFYSELLSRMENELGIVYMRPTSLKTDFDIPTDWMDWRANCHHDNMEAMSDRFLALDTQNELKVFYVWGHAHELYDTYQPENTSKVRFDDLDRLCSKFADRSAVWAATNIEVHDYAEAMKKAVVDYEKCTVSNPSDIDLYFIVNGEKVMIPAGQTAQF